MNFAVRSCMSSVYLLLLLGTSISFCIGIVYTFILNKLLLFQWVQQRFRSCRGTRILLYSGQTSRLSGICRTLWSLCVGCQDIGGGSVSRLVIISMYIYFHDVQST